MSRQKIIGVLALQGDFERHLHHLNVLGIPGVEIRRRGQLDAIDGLIIPGGESTTMTELIDRFGFRDSLKKFFKEKAVWGTCAGSILLAREVDDDRVKPFNVINVSIIRNGYGRQVHSFSRSLSVKLNGRAIGLEVSFIRAPVIDSVGKDVTILAEHENKPVLLCQDKCLVSTFHSELHDNPALTEYFVDHFVLDSSV